jgi:uncharacterized delta-60 repeat protein
MLIRICLLAVLAASPVFAAPGDLDPTFGDQGNVELTGGASSSGIDIVVQPDDRVVVAGSEAGDIVKVVRLLENGALDPSFGTGGIVSMAVRDNEEPLVGIARQGDGKLVVAATAPAFNFTTDFLVARLEVGGALDAGFGAGGIATVDFDVVERVSSVLVQADGKVVVAGTANTFALVRLDADGSLDPSFGGDGVVRPDPGEPLSSFSGTFDVVQQPDGKLVAVGYAGFDDDQDTAIARYETDGSLDPSFGVGGIVVLPVNATERDAANGVAIQADGKIVVTGDAGPFFNADLRLFVARLDATGGLDPGFGAGGVFDLESSGGADILEDAAGRIVVAGGLIVSPAPVPGMSESIVVRLLADGTLDPAFGVGGVVRNERYGSATASEIMLGVVEDSRGRIGTTGSATTSLDVEPRHIALSRFLVGDCGNGEIESDEDCDDGATVDGDCCSSACHLDGPGTACDGSGDLCAYSSCDGAGACVTATAPDPTCEESLGPNRGTLRIASPANPNRRTLRWTWTRGTAEIEDFGDPRSETDVSLCMYDGSGGLVSRIDVPAGATCGSEPCWDRSSRAYEYRDPARTRSGLGLLRLRSGGPGRASLTAIAKGSLTPVPVLPLSTPVKVQLRAANGGCWGVDFAAGSVQRNDDTTFRARAE